MFEPVSYLHGSKLSRKAKTSPELKVALGHYKKWKARSLSVDGREKEDIELLTGYLNSYKDAVEDIFDSRSNSAQEILQPSIIEEFMEYLFCQLGREFNSDLYRNMGSSFYDLIIHPCSFDSLRERPEYTLRKKDQDFVIGFQATLSLKVNSSDITQTEEILIPAVAIECKRYLERNMMDECSGTAKKIQSATPYCKFYVVAEYLKMDDAAPEKTGIDEIYILRHQKNSDRLKSDFTPNPIDSELVWEFYSEVIGHLKSVWWDKESGLKVGKVFNFP